MVCPGGNMSLAKTEPLPTVSSVRAAAEVQYVEEPHGFVASVMVTPTDAAVRLDRSTIGAPHEGTVLRWVMMKTTGLGGFGLFDYRLDG
jgi:hypothetical protein